MLPARVALSSGAAGALDPRRALAEDAGHMAPNLPPPGALFQFRKGGEVLLARAVGAKAGKVVATDEDGRKVELPPDRVLQLAGHVEAGLSDVDARARLRE